MHPPNSADYFAMALAATTDIDRASRLAIILLAVAWYFLKCSVSRCAFRAASLSKTS